jgi:SNW domain-containing protein 1
MYDQRLFNQTAGLGSGFGHEEDYNLYDKPLFADRTNASIYKNVKNLDVS